MLVHAKALLALRRASGVGDGNGPRRGSGWHGRPDVPRIKHSERGTGSVKRNLCSPYEMASVKHYFCARCSVVRSEVHNRLLLWSESRIQSKDHTVGRFTLRHRTATISYT